MNEPQNKLNPGKKLFDRIRYGGQGKDDSLAALLLRGHLAIETLMTQIMQRAYPQPEALEHVATMFYRKAKLLRAIGRIDRPTEVLLLGINVERNRLAERFDAAIDFDAVCNLLEKARTAGMAFSDPAIGEADRPALERLGVERLLQEVLCATFRHVLAGSEGRFTTAEIEQLRG